MRVRKSGGRRALRAVSPPHPMQGRGPPTEVWITYRPPARRAIFPPPAAVGSSGHQMVRVTVTVAPGWCWVGRFAGGALVASQFPSPLTRNHSLPSTFAVGSPRTQAPLTTRVTSPSTVMSCPPSVFPSQSTEATVSSPADAVAPSSPKGGGAGEPPHLRLPPFQFARHGLVGRVRHGRRAEPARVARADTADGDDRADDHRSRTPNPPQCPHEGSLPPVRRGR